jgi:mRNA interferase MazF
MYEYGTVVLLEYPYTDLAGAKLRPAIVIKDTNDSDLIVVRATSQIHKSDYDITVEDWQSAGLLKPTIIRVHKLTAIETKLVKRKMGMLSARDLYKFV